MPDKKTDPEQPKDNLSTSEFIAAVDAAVAAYLDKNLADLVAAAMPETKEQQAQRERESYEESVRKQQDAAARKAKRDAKAQAKADAEAAERQAKADAAAAKEFDEAVPFTGSVVDITPAIVRKIRIDDGKAYSADHDIPVRHSELEATVDGQLLLTKPIELPARSREFSVKGISLVTDAGVMRIALNGSRKCGGGKAVQFPAKSLAFRPFVPKADAAVPGTDAE